MTDVQLTALGKALAPVAYTMIVEGLGGRPSPSMPFDLVMMEESAVWAGLWELLGQERMGTVQTEMYAEYERLYRS